MVLSLLALSSSLATTDEYITDESEDSVGAPHRVKIPPFTLTFSPTNGLTATQADAVEELAEDALRDLFPSKVGEGVTIAYVDLIIRNGARMRRLQENGTEVLQIAGGIVIFRGGEPTLDEVNAWVGEALEGNLLELVHEETDLDTVTSITFNFLTPAPTPAPQVISGLAMTDATKSDPTNSVVLAMASVVGGIAFIALMVVATFLMRRRRRRSPYVDLIDDGGASIVKSLPPGVTDVVEEPDEERSLKAGENLPQVKITATTQERVPKLPKFDDDDTLKTDQHLLKCDDTAESVSPSLSTLSTNAPHLRQGGSGPGTGFLCAFQIIEGSCLCHVSRKK